MRNKIDSKLINHHLSINLNTSCTNIEKDKIKVYFNNEVILPEKYSFYSIPEQKIEVDIENLFRNTSGIELRVEVWDYWKCVLSADTTFSIGYFDFVGKSLTVQMKKDEVLKKSICDKLLGQLKKGELTKLITCMKEHQDENNIFCISYVQSVKSYIQDNLEDFCNSKELQEINTIIDEYEKYK